MQAPVAVPGSEQAIVQGSRGSREEERRWTEANEEETGETALNWDGLVRCFFAEEFIPHIEQYSLTGMAPHACLQTKRRTELLRSTQNPNQTQPRIKEIEVLQAKVKMKESYDGSLFLIAGPEILSWN